MKPEENLVNYIKSHDEEEINKGLDVFEGHSKKIAILEKKRKRYFITVPGENTNRNYSVSLNVLKDDVLDDCNCKAYKSYGWCKHAIAAALALMEKEFDYDIDELESLIDMEDAEEESNFIETKRALHPETKKQEKKKQETNTPAETIVPVTVEWKKIIHNGPIDPGNLNVYSAYSWPSFHELNKITQTSFDRQELHWIFSFKEKHQEYIPEIRYDAAESYFYRCTCNHRNRHLMCPHVRLAFEKLIQHNNHNYFLQFKEWTKEKNLLLQPYGLTVADEEAKSFKFTVTNYGELTMQAPATFIRPDDKEQFKKMNHLFRLNKGLDMPGKIRPKPLPGVIIDFEAAFVLNVNSQRLILGFELEAARLYHRQNKTDLKRLSINQPATLSLLKELSDEMYTLLIRLSDSELLDHLQERGSGYLKNYGSPWQHMTEQTTAVLRKHYIECLQKLWPYLGEHPNVFLLKDGKFSSANCKRITVSADAIDLSFRVENDGRFITIWLMPVVNGKEPDDCKIEVMQGFIFCINGILHVIKNIEDLPVVEQFRNGFIKVASSSKFEVIQNIISPLQERYTVELPEDFKIKTTRVKPLSQVLLKEFSNQFLMLQPQFLYEEMEVDYSTNPGDIPITLPDGSLQIIKRDATAEKEFLEILRPLHDTFSRQRQNDFFYVHFNEVMRGNWFLNTVRYLQENNITVKGMQELKRFRYNANKPKWEMKAGSGVDWFDLRVKITFGNQEVALRDVRKAVLARQNIVVLGDGTFGVLPEEWLKQYGLLLKLSDEQKDGSLRLSKLHFTVIDELYTEIDDDKILREINEKKQKLKDIENIRTTRVSKHIKAELRPYQLSGFKWMQTLDELGWGGCLADDMGLGKTLQTIVFLQCMKEKYYGCTHLVVCPTSLIYNWENELKKFAPELRYHIYYGFGREFTDEHFENYDIIITSYGLVRNDMEQLLRFQWHYVILDESQAIKNPEAQTTKAVQLLKSKNRLILSGTPVQNNTFDLFAQFNFLNAGLLGNREFYKTEFANPIDKYNDTEKSKQLRRLVYPFLLRRTKEEVAKDLPDKTETILWCQLPKDQRSVYEDYKSYYRNMLIQKIEEEGMGKAGMYVLEGLLRLRQICDSPQLLKDPGVTTSESIKIKELLREIEENTGTHKLLVFSQFTGMLHLLQKALDEKGISYCYLDGSTPAEKRKLQVEKFQTDEKIKIFLISLKAGGVGLNLTAADYVYVVDPWWNLAVEQQAIDRTHRIGQTQNIFAYKMICKDTVEEKILQLQKRKRQLANELVTEDAGFIKKLNREDVEFLFS